MSPAGRPSPAQETAGSAHPSRDSVCRRLCARLRPSRSAHAGSHTRQPSPFPLRATRTRPRGVCPAATSPQHLPPLVTPTRPAAARRHLPPRVPQGRRRCRQARPHPRVAPLQPCDTPLAPHTPQPAPPRGPSPAPARPRPGPRPPPATGPASARALARLSPDPPGRRPRGPLTNLGATASTRLRLGVPHIYRGAGAGRRSRGLGRGPGRGAPPASPPLSRRYSPRRRGGSARRHVSAASAGGRA